MIDWLCTKERAVEHALELAQEIVGTQPVMVVVEGPNGNVEEAYELHALAS